MNTDYDFEFTLQLAGQCPSGKNAITITRMGHRFPNQRFVDWRFDAMKQLFAQLKEIKAELPFSFPVEVEVEYTAKDRIRRDVPGIVDALWHLLEKVGVVTDDTFLSGFGQRLLFIHKGVNKYEAGVIITIRGNYGSSAPLYKKQKRVRAKNKLGRINVRTCGASRKKSLARRNFVRN